MVEIGSDTCCDHGVNMDIWCADSGGGRTSPSGLHLHHHGGIPRCLHLPHSGGFLQASQKCLCQVVDDKGQRVRLPQQVLLNISLTTNCKFQASFLAVGLYRSRGGGGQIPRYFLKGGQGIAQASTLCSSLVLYLTHVNSESKFREFS